MSQPKFCFNCGAPLAGGELFCSKCGKRLYASPPAPAAPVAPAVPNASTTAPVVANTPPAPSNNITLQQVGSALGSFFGAAAVAIHNAPPHATPATGGAHWRGPGCMHCNNGGICLSCHGSGKFGSLDCVHCDGSGICIFCGEDLINQGYKAWQRG